MNKGGVPSPPTQSYPPREESPSEVEMDEVWGEVVSESDWGGDVWGGSF